MTYPRPRIHYTPQRNWMNDPNGLVFVDGIWHLYYQYNPEGSDWGNMSWGHATSPDLIEWTEHPVALMFTREEAVFSGSIVVDHDNSSGFGDGVTPPLVALFTSVLEERRQAQSVAFSLDGGYVWERYAGNPVLDRGSKDFRDPKILRAADRDGRERWVMVAVEAVLRQVVIYSSSDLLTWTFESAVGPHGPDDVVWECPDLFPLATPDDTDDPAARRWVMLLSANEPADGGSSSMSYGIGRFDGHTFTPDRAGAWPTLDYGDDFYAAVSFDNTGDERVILGWASNWRYAAALPTEPWRGTMTLARRVSLESRGGELVLVQNPMPALPEGGDRSEHGGGGGDDRAAVELPLGQHAVLDIQWTLAADAIVDAELLMSATAPSTPACSLRYDASAGRLSLTRSVAHPDDFPAGFATTRSAPVPLEGDTLHLTVVVDGTLVEVFADGGAVCLTELVFPERDARSARFSTVASDASVRVAYSTF